MFLVCLESIIHVTGLPRCTLLSGDEHRAPRIVMLAVWFQSMSPGSGAFFSSPSGQPLTSHHPPSELKADNVQISGFTASFLSWFCFPFFSPEMKRKEIIVPIKHPFSSPLFFSGASLWCVNYSTLQRAAFGARNVTVILYENASFLLSGHGGGCVVMRGGSPPGRWEVKDCSNFKAMSLCKMPVKTWETPEFEGRWPFHACYLDWESKSGLANCFKVMSRLSA